MKSSSLRTAFISLFLVSLINGAAISQRDSTSNISGCEPVNTTSGRFIGHPVSARPAVTEFLGLRYAQPPVGTLRFAAPVAYNSSEVVIAAQQVRVLLHFLSHVTHQTDR